MSSVKDASASVAAYNEIYKDAAKDQGATTADVQKLQDQMSTDGFDLSTKTTSGETAYDDLQDMKSLTAGSSGRSQSDMNAAWNRDMNDLQQLISAAPTGSKTAKAYAAPGNDSTAAVAGTDSAAVGTIAQYASDDSQDTAMRKDIKTTAGSGAGQNIQYGQALLTQAVQGGDPEAIGKAERKLFLAYQSDSKTTGKSNLDLYSTYLSAINAAGNSTAATQAKQSISNLDQGTTPWPTATGS